MSSKQPVNEESFLQQEAGEDDEDIDIMDDNFFDEAGTEEPELSNEATADTSNRNMKSLGMLTKRFIKFLQDSPVGLVDINSAADKLNVTQKRRVYDITNVLEGIGMIEKKSKNVILWKGGQLRKPGGEIDLKPSEERNLHEIKNEITDLEREERLLETHLKWIKQSMRNVCEDQDIYKFAYVFRDETINVFENNKLLLIQAPPGTDIHVGQPTILADEVKYHLRAKSHSGPATFSVVSDESDQYPSLMHREPRAKRTKLDFEKVPSKILENDEDESVQEKPTESTNGNKTENLRSLSPPPNEMDYIYGQTRGETLSELFETDFY